MGMPLLWLAHRMQQNRGNIIIFLIKFNNSNKYWVGLLWQAHRMQQNPRNINIFIIKCNKSDEVW